MKTKDLIKILRKFKPDSEVRLAFAASEAGEFIDAVAGVGTQEDTRDPVISTATAMGECPHCAAGTEHHEANHGQG